MTTNTAKPLNNPQRRDSASTDYFARSLRVVLADPWASLVEADAPLALTFDACPADTDADVSPPNATATHEHRLTPPLVAGYAWTQRVFSVGHRELWAS